MKIKYTDPAVVAADKALHATNMKLREATSEHDAAVKAMARAIHEAIEAKLVKPDGTITDLAGHTFYFERVIVSYGDFYVLCHPAKKDGTPSRQDRHMFLSSFTKEI